MGCAVATVDDRWTKKVDGKKVRSAAWGRGLRWTVRWVDADGHQRRRSFTLQDEAIAEAAAVEVAVRQGTFVDPQKGRRTVLWYARDWAASHAGGADNTARWHRGIVEGRILRDWASKPVATVTQADVQRWLARLSGEGLSASRVRGHHVVLRGALDQAVQDNALAKNPAIPATRGRRGGVQLPKLARKLPAFLDPAEVAAAIRALETGRRADAPERPAPTYQLSRRQQAARELAEQRRAAAGERRACFALVLAFSGLRFGEAAALKVGDLDGRRLSVRAAIATVGGRQVLGETKTHRDRVVVLPEAVAERVARLAEGRGPDEPLLPAVQGGPWHYGTWRDTWVRACDLATTHGLRHTAASLAIRAGADLKALQRMIGHASATLTLDTYGHLYDTQLEGVADALAAFVPAPLRAVPDLPADSQSAGRTAAESPAVVPGLSPASRGKSRKRA